MILQGGPNLYGIPLGVIGLESNYAKMPGHIKNASTFDFPVIYRNIEGLSVHRLVREADSRLLEPIISGMRALEKEGVLAITGSCGFFALFQREMADAVNIPVFSSSLLQVPMVHCMLKRDQTVGIITARKNSLSKAHLTAVGAGDTPVKIAGMEDQPEFCEVILEARRLALDIEKLKHEVLTVADAFIKNNPDVGALVLECTDLPSFAPLIMQKVDRPVFDIITLTNMVYQAVIKKEYVGLMPKQTGP